MYNLSIEELFLLIIVFIFLLISFNKQGYKKGEMFFWSLAFIPVLFFSIHMLTEAITMDEPGYEICITNIRALKTQIKAQECLYEYKVTQLILGTFFLLIPNKIKNLLGYSGIWQTYKMIHWALIFSLIYITYFVWYKLILTDKKPKQNIFVANMVLMLLMGLPLSCQLLKVTNYDASSTYFAILGISIFWAAYNNNKSRLAFWATVVAGLSVMEKWTAFPYWAICVLLYVFFCIEKAEKKKIQIAIKEIIKTYSIMLFISLLYFCFAFLQQKGFYKDINIETIFFSFIYAPKAFLFGSWAESFDTTGTLISIPIFSLMVFLLAFLLYGVMVVLKNKSISLKELLFKINSFILLLGFVGGIIATYFLPLRISPYCKIDIGEFLSHDYFDGWTYHFGAKTTLGHFICKFCYMWATILSNYPTIIIFIGLFCIIVLLINNENENNSLICSLILSAAVSLLILYCLTGLPYDARYYSFSLFIIALCFLYVLYLYINFTAWVKISLSVGFVLYLFEMNAYAPNIRNFSPVWIQHTDEFNKTFRTGIWTAGETMFWGEEIALAGNKIIKYINADTDFKDVKIISNYGRVWPKNPGFKIYPLTKNNLYFDSNTYYVLNKFMMFRDEKPPFIENEKPLFTLSYKGEIGAWIFSGEQLKTYQNYFLTALKK